MKEKKESLLHNCSHICKVLLVIYILIHYTKITVNFIYLLEGHTARLCSTQVVFEIRSDVALMITINNISFKTICEPSGKDRFIHVVVFSWNALMTPAREKPSDFVIFPLSSNPEHCRKASITWEKSADLQELVQQSLHKVTHSQKSWGN